MSGFDIDGKHYGDDLSDEACAEALAIIKELRRITHAANVLKAACDASRIVTDPEKCS